MSAFGVGYSETSDSYTAGRRAASEAVVNGGIEGRSVDVCFLFCTSRHTPDEFWAGVKSVTGDCPMIGGYANGTISNDNLGYDGFQTIVGLLSSETIQPYFFLQQGIAFNEYFTGKRLAQKIDQQLHHESPVILLFFDAVNRLEGRFQMNYGTPLVRGFYEVFKKMPEIAGARMMGDMKFKPTYQWYENQMVQNSALAVALTGNVSMEVLILHGCTPASAYHTVTGAQGAAILEIDYKPALDFVCEILGSDFNGEYQKLKFFVTMGKNLGDKWSLDNSTNYVNRMCVGVDAEKRGLVMAEMDLDVGTEFQLMRRGFQMDAIEQKTRSFISKIKSEEKKPLVAFYFNCAGRAAAYSQNRDEDARLVQKAIDGAFPLLGIYEGGELAKVNGALQVLDWTGVLCVLSENIQP